MTSRAGKLARTPTVILDRLNEEARSLLRRADLVLYDYLVNPQLLDHARAGAELLCLGRHGREPRLSQSEINALMVKLAQEGKRVVRLKAGVAALFPGNRKAQIYVLQKVFTRLRSHLKIPKPGPAARRSISSRARTSSSEEATTSFPSSR